MKVLVIEDQLIAAMQLIGTLRLLGHEVEHQKTAEAAWARQIETGYRLIVCDWRMPGMNGLDFCRKLRAYGGDYVYFILVSTTKITKESRDEALRPGSMTSWPSRWIPTNWECGSMWPSAS